MYVTLRFEARAKSTADCGFCSRSTIRPKTIGPDNRPGPLNEPKSNHFDRASACRSPAGQRITAPELILRLPSPATIGLSQAALGASGFTPVAFKKGVLIKSGGFQGWRLFVPSMTNLIVCNLRLWRFSGSHVGARLP